MYGRERQVFTKEFGLGLTTVPDTTTDVQTLDCYIKQIVACNKTAGAATFVVKDKATSAKTLIDASIAANTTYVIVFPDCVFMDNGFTWESNTASAIDAEVFGFVRFA